MTDEIQEYRAALVELVAEVASVAPGWDEVSTTRAPYRPVLLPLQALHSDDLQEVERATLDYALRVIWPIGEPPDGSGLELRRAEILWLIGLNVVSARLIARRLGTVDGNADARRALEEQWR